MKQQYIDTDELLMEEDEKSFDLKKWFFRMLELWPWFLVSLLVCSSAVYLYLLHTSPVYEAVASVMVKDEKKGADLLDNSALKEIGVRGNPTLVENEIEILNSYDLMEGVVDKLQLFLSVKRVGRFRDVDVFGDEIPFSIEVTNPEDIVESSQWTITGTDRGIYLKTQSSKAPIFLQYGQPYVAGEIKFRCTVNSVYGDRSLQGNDSSKNVYKLYLNPVDKTILNYSGKLSVEAASKLGTVINLKIRDINEKRAVAILDSLIYNYNEAGLEDKNRVSDNTIDFLNKRLFAVAGKLQGVEGSVEKLKSDNKVTNLSSDAQQYLASSQQVDAQKTQSQTQLNIINALEGDLELNQDNPQLVPSTLGIQEPSLGLLIEKHNELVLQKERMQQKSGPKNPLLLDLQNQIKELRTKLLTNVRNLKQAYTISLDDISRKDAELSSRIRNVPQLEKKLVEITRNQDVQQQIYTFLLQKREEAALTRASNIEDSRTIKKSRSLGSVWPKSKIIWILGIILGLSLPAAFVWIKDFLNNKIGNVSQIEQSTDVPLLGTISHVKKLRSPLVLRSLSRTIVAEQVRNIRTGISSSRNQGGVKTILVTSYQPGDGKSFVSVNLGAAYSLLDKKTVILEFDLRRPHIAKDLGLDTQKGIGDILRDRLNPDDLIVQIPGYNNNLFLLPAGYLPDNSAELISGSGMDFLIDKLRQRFDYIIIDTPPFKLFTDATLLLQYADISLIVLRQGHTSQDVYPELKKRIALYPDVPTRLVLNDAGRKKSYGSGAGYRGYGYVSGNGHNQVEN